MINVRKSLAATVLAATLAFAAEASAQSFSMVPPPAPADNQAVALRDGKQLVGLGNKCIQVGGALDQLALLTLQDCNPNSPNQRFKFENGRLMTSARILTWTSGAMGMREPGSMRWEQACIAAISEWRLQAQRCRDWNAKPDQGPVNWRLNGREIRSGNVCFDVRQDSTANGTLIIHWGCQGKSNQQWAMR
jgi:hypothetical protein